MAVALGLASFSLGTDTAGSGRVPAAFNNLVGYKPTLGSLSMRGVVPACRSLDAMSIFALTAEDAAHVARVAVKFDAADAWSRPAGKPRRRGCGQRAIVPLCRAARRHNSSSSATRPMPQLFDGSRCERLRSPRRRSRHEVDIEPLLETARLLYEGPWVAERYLATESLLTIATRRDARVTRQIIAVALHPRRSTHFAPNTG